MQLFLINKRHHTNETIGMAQTDLKPEYRQTASITQGDYSDISWIGQDWDAQVTFLGVKFGQSLLFLVNYLYSFSGFLNFCI